MIDPRQGASQLLGSGPPTGLPETGSTYAFLDAEASLFPREIQG